MAGKVGVAVLGLGRQGAPRLQRLMDVVERLNLRWIVDKDVEAARQLSSLIPSKPQVVKPWKWDDVCNDKSVDAVLVCGPYATVNMVRKALRRGKSVMCDRPVSLQTAAILACYEEARGTNKKLMFAFTRRFDQTLSEIQSRVSGGEIGKVNTIRSSICYTPHDPEMDLIDKASIFRDCVSQEIDTISWLVNQIPQSVFATGSGLLCDGHGRDHSQHESVSMTMRFPAGTIATVDVTKTTCHHEQHLEINGDSGSILVDPHHPDGTAVHSVSHRGSSTSVLQEPPVERYENAFMTSVDHFLDVVQGKDEPQLSIMDTLRSITIASACRDSHNTNATIAQQTQKPCENPQQVFEKPLWKECPEIFPSPPVYLENSAQ